MNKNSTNVRFLSPPLPYRVNFLKIFQGWDGDTWQSGGVAKKHSYKLMIKRNHG